MKEETEQEQKDLNEFYGLLGVRSGDEMTKLIKELSIADVGNASVIELRELRKLVEDYRNPGNLKTRYELDILSKEYDRIVKAYNIRSK